MKTQETAPQQPAMEGPEAAGKSLAAPAFSLTTSPAEGGGGDKKPRDVNKEPKTGLFAKTETFNGPLESMGPGDSHPISPNDLEQGNIGDCTVIASLIAVASASPKALEDLVCDNGDGTYLVRLAVPTEEGAFEWKDITVKPDFVKLRSGAPKYAIGMDDKEIWPMLFEKAFAQVEGSYRKIVGKDYEQALSALTGEKSESQTVADMMDDEELMFQIRYATRNGRPITAGSYNRIDMESISGAVDPDMVLTKHQYAIISADRTAGTVTMRNPWNSKSEMIVPLADFKLFIEEITIGPKLSK